MKIFFVKEDSLYKIFKTLEKIPKLKDVEIFIDQGHSIFDNIRRGKQIKETLGKREIKATFTTKSSKCKSYFQEIGLTTHYQETSQRKKVLNAVYLFIFNIKKFHLHSYNKKNYTFFIVLIFEIVFVLVVLSLLYSLILPSAKFRVTPSKQIDTIIYNFRYYPYTDKEFARYSRYLSVPYYQGHIDYKYDLSINADNIDYIHNPSKGSVKIINLTQKEYTFVPNTRFITDNGLLFKTDKWINIPAAYQNIPGELTIELTAMEQDDFGIFMGVRSNIPKETTLYVRNIKQSVHLKKLYAIALDDFKGGNLESHGTITQEDIDILSGKLLNYISINKRQIAKQNFNIDNAILLSFSDIIHFDTLETNIKNQVGDKLSKINGNIKVKIYFYYIKREDLLPTFQKYVKQRPLQQNTVLNIDKDSLILLEDIKIEDNIFIIPSKINIIQGYNLEKDINGILDEIKFSISGLSEEEARKILLSYPEILGVRIKITPIWYNTIPNLKSRINFEIRE